VYADHLESKVEAQQKAVELFELHLGPMGNFEPYDLDEWLAPLRGQDLLCWCGPNEPCHVDILLKLANRPVAV
jgi:hypothetical protein